MEAKLTRQPLHNVLALIIIKANSFAQLDLIGELIKAVEIPKNHQVIMMAWENQLKKVGVVDDYGVMVTLREQKREAEEEKRFSGQNMEDRVRNIHLGQ